VGRDLLLQVRPASDRAKAFQVDGVDSKLRASECDPDYFAVGRHCGGPIVRRESIGGRDWYRADYWSRGYHRFVPGMHLFVFENGMSALPKQALLLPPPLRLAVS